MSEYPVENVERIKKMKAALGAVTDKELANILGVHRSQIIRMKKRGMYPVYKRTIDLLLNKIFL